MNDVLEEVYDRRMHILESFTEEFGATKQLLI